MKICVEIEREEMRQASLGPRCAGSSSQKASSVQCGVGQKGGKKGKGRQGIEREKTYMGGAVQA